MLRWLAILALGLSAARGVGIGALASTPDDCLAPSCVTPAAPIAPSTASSCCPLGGQGDIAQGDPRSDQKSVCPMSAGVCRCGLSPGDDDHRPLPAPAPSQERNPMQSVHQASQLVHPVASDAPAPAAMGQAAPTRRALFSHNRYLSLLGIWRR